MRVLHVIPSVSEVRGGPSHAVLAMVRALLSVGVDAEIVTTDDDGPAVLDVPFDELVDRDGSPVRFFPRFSPRVAPVREFAYSGPLSRWVSGHLADFDAVHVHAIFSYPSTAAMAIARRAGTPYVVRPLGQLCEWALRQSALRKSVYMRAVERRNLDGASAIHFTSDRERDEAADLHLAAASFVLPHGIRPPERRPDARAALRSWLGIEPDERVVLFLSRIHPVKGLNLLIEAIASLPDVPFRFVLAGAGAPDYEREVDGMIERAGIAARTIRVGHVRGDRKDLLLQGADLFALTSHTENFGVAVLEALASGTPALVSREVGLAAAVRDHDLGVVVDLNPESIAAGLRRALGDPSPLDAWRRRAETVVRDVFSWESVARRLAGHYEDAVARRAAGAA